MNIKTINSWFLLVVLLFGSENMQCMQTTTSETKPVTLAQDPSSEWQAEKLKQKVFWSDKAQQRQKEKGLTNTDIAKWLKNVQRLYTPSTASHEAIKELIDEYAKKESITTAQKQEKIINSAPEAQDIKARYLAEFDEEKENPLKRAREKIIYAVEDTPEYEALAEIIADYPSYQPETPSEESTELESGSINRPVAQTQPIQNDIITLIAQEDNPQKIGVEFTLQQLKFSLVIQHSIEDLQKTNPTLFSFPIERIALKDLQTMKMVTSTDATEMNQRAMLFTRLASYTPQELDRFFQEADFFDFVLYVKKPIRDQEGKIVGYEGEKPLKIDLLSMLDNIHNVTLSMISSLLKMHIDDEVKNNIMQNILNYLEIDSDILISYLFDHAKTNVVELGERSRGARNAHCTIELIDFSRHYVLIQSPPLYAMDCSDEYYYLYNIQKNKAVYNIRRADLAHKELTITSRVQTMSPDGKILIFKPQSDDLLLLWLIDSEEKKILKFPNGTFKNYHQYEYLTIQRYQFRNNRELELFIKIDTKLSKVITVNLSGIDLKEALNLKAKIIDTQTVNTNTIKDSYLSKSITDKFLEKCNKTIENQNSNQTKYKPSKSFKLHSCGFLIAVHVEKEQQGYIFSTLLDDVYVIDLMPHFDSCDSPFKQILYLLAHKITNWDTAYDNEINEIFDLIPKPKVPYQNPVKEHVRSLYGKIRQKVTEQATEHIASLKSSASEKITSFVNYLKNRVSQSQLLTPESPSGVEEPLSTIIASQPFKSEGLASTIKNYFNRAKWW